MSHTLYLALPAVRVVEFHAHAGAYLLGVPQPTTVAGFVHALGLALNKMPGVQLEQAPGVAYGVSDWSGCSGLSLHKQQVVKSKATDGTPIDDRVRASVSLSLIVELVLSDDSMAPTVEQLEAQVEKMRIQGGSLFMQAPAMMFTELADVFRYLPGDVFFLTDAVTDMEEALAAGSTTAEALLAHITRPTDGSYKPRWVPALVGWRGLTDEVNHPSRKQGADVLAIAEPVIGLAQFRAKGAFKAWALDPDSPVFWRHATEQTPSMHYVVKGTSPFVPTEFVF